LHHGLVGFDVDLGDFERRLIEDRRLDLGGDRGVVDVLTGAFLRRGGRATDGEQHGSCKEYRERLFKRFHDGFPEIIG